MFSAFINNGRWRPSWNDKLQKIKRFFLFFTVLMTYVPLIFHAKIQPKISSGTGEEIGFVILLFLVTATILDIRP